MVVKMSGLHSRNHEANGGRTCSNVPWGTRLRIRGPPGLVSILLPRLRHQELIN
jgi:hypothetical protein